MENLNGWSQIINLPIVTHQEEGFQWNLEELENILTETISNCVKKCLAINKGRIFTTLSGGLDSSLCLALIRKKFGRKIPIHTFTIGESYNFPDIKYARLVAQKFKTIHYELIPTKAEIETTALIKKTNSWIFPNESENRDGVGVFLLCQFIRNLFPEEEAIAIIAHDGIDELMGGYWDHRKYEEESLKEKEFERYWKLLPSNHLMPLTAKAEIFCLSIIFPYLEEKVVKYISQIPVNERTSHEESKMPLRRIAEKYLPQEIIKRPKIGFGQVLTTDHNKL